MTTNEATDVFKEYLTTKIVPRPIELIEASKIAIKVLTQQLEETDKQYHWKPSEHQMNILKAVKDYVSKGSGYWGEELGSLIEDLEKL